MLNEFMTFVQELTARLREETGQALVEYGLIIALVAVACIGALGVLSGNIQTLFNGITF